MVQYVIRRLLLIIPTLLIISIISFVIIQAPPGDYLTSQLQTLQQLYGEAAQMVMDQMRQQYNLDKPIIVQYLTWMANLLRGDFGYSFLERRPVSDILAARLPLTVALTSLALIFTWAVALPVGIYSAVRQYTAFDYVITVLSFLGLAVPNFLLALVLLYFMYVNFGWSFGGLVSKTFINAPLSLAKIGDIARNLILPIVVIGVSGIAGTVRVLRGMVLDELGKAYVRTARAKGLSERSVHWKHILKIAVLPMVSSIGWLLPQMVGREMIAAIVLNLPTTGTALYSALISQDMYVAGSIMLVLSIYVVVATLASDVLLVFLDPRIRHR
jgi:peptide/nickel transport system permease protein